MLVLLKLESYELVYLLASLSRRVKGGITQQAVRVATQYAPAHACKLTISSHLFARWHLFRHVGYLRHQQQVDSLTLKVVSESRVTWATSVPILVFLGPLFSS